MTKYVDKLDYILGREKIWANMNIVREVLKDKTVLITGAGGSIGSVLCKMVAAAPMKQLIMVESSEKNLYQVDYDLKDCENLNRLAVIADVRNKGQMNYLIKTHKPDVVFHAAALKHVPILEISHNFIEAVRTNVLGTRNVVDACIEHGVPDFVLVSTDKAVNPHSLMGTTKRIAEMYARKHDFNSAINCTVVRFGNVVGSSGSILPLFEKQIEQGLPVTVTDKDVTRYMMRIEEAAWLILASYNITLKGFRGKGDVCVLDMGEPIKIVDFVTRLQEWWKEHRKIKPAGIKFIGMRYGEKMHEELFNEDEMQHPAYEGTKVLIGIGQPPRDISMQIEALESFTLKNDMESVMSAIKTLVPEYTGYII